MNQRKNLRALLALLVLALGAGVLASCGGGDGNGSSNANAQANDVDRAFVRSMIPHHESAVDMAEIARRKGQHKQIKILATNIITTQKAEIDQLTGIGSEIGVEVPGGEDGMSHDAHSTGGDSMGGDGDLETLGLSAEEAGMAMDAESLANAKPFDRAFIDMMVPHHEGAIRMAKAELAKGENTELKSIAEKIVSAQEREIKEMNSWRTDWYGAPVTPGSS